MHVWDVWGSRVEKDGQKAGKGEQKSTWSAAGWGGRQSAGSPEALAFWAREWRRLLQEALRQEGLPVGSPGGGAAAPSAAYLEACLGAGREPSGEGGSRSRLPEASSLRMVPGIMTPWIDERLIGFSMASLVVRSGCRTLGDPGLSRWVPPCWGSAWEPEAGNRRGEGGLSNGR